MVGIEDIWKNPQTFTTPFVESMEEFDEFINAILNCKHAIETNFMVEIRQETYDEFLYRYEEYKRQLHEKKLTMTSKSSFHFLRSDIFYGGAVTVDLKIESLDRILKALKKEFNDLFSFPLQDDYQLLMKDKFPEKFIEKYIEWCEDKAHKMMCRLIVEDDGKAVRVQMVH